MKTLFIIPLVLMSLVSVSNLAKAENFYFRCVDEDNFQKNFLIKPSEKRVVHWSSYNKKTNHRFDVKEDVDIIDWKLNSYIYFIKRKNYPISSYTIYFADFSENILLQSGLLPFMPEPKDIQSHRSVCYKD